MTIVNKIYCFQMDAKSSGQWPSVIRIRADDMEQEGSAFTLKMADGEIVGKIGGDTYIAAWWVEKIKE